MLFSSLRSCRVEDYLLGDWCPCHTSLGHRISALSLPAVAPPFRGPSWAPLEDTKGSIAHRHSVLLPLSDLLDGHHHFLVVILGLAPGFSLHGPAGLVSAPGLGPACGGAACYPRTQATHQTLVPLLQGNIPPGDAIFLWKALSLKKVLPRIITVLSWYF